MASEKEPPLPLPVMVATIVLAEELKEKALRASTDPRSPADTKSHQATMAVSSLLMAAANTMREYGSDRAEAAVKLREAADKIERGDDGASGLFDQLRAHVDREKANKGPCDRPDCLVCKARREGRISKGGQG